MPVEGETTVDELDGELVVADERGTVVRPRQTWSLLDPDLIRWRHRGPADPRFLRDLSEVRFIIEPQAARFAATRRDPSDLAALVESLTAMKDAGDDPDAVIEADLTFHRVLLLAAHNELLGQMEAVIEAGLLLRDRLVHRHAPWLDPVPEHRTVLDAVQARDSDAAEAAMVVLLHRAWNESNNDPEAEKPAPRKDQP